LPFKISPKERDLASTILSSCQVYHKAVRTHRRIAFALDVDADVDAADYEVVCLLPHIKK